MDRWMHAWIDGWLDEWMIGWINGRLTRGMATCEWVDWMWRLFMLS